jgi:hypothetical protein
MMRMVKENMRSKLLIASIFAALMAGTGIAAAQVDDPPGSSFQDRGIREDLGRTATPSVWSRTAGRARAEARARAQVYGYIPAPAAPRHRVVQHHR